MYKIVILHIWISSVEIDFKHLKYVYIIRICLCIYNWSFASCVWWVRNVIS